ncbi:hypothetical protein L596_024600 [Steinernema carpocapsae]|uniref:Uncharacterized protein n=1 Tax=Steinernema carpocapsae TaxID=34508 RepID=A0A4U5MHN5_STECR|nr:hypothetical protein L596_024600 [Steinernema carpocapsae]
MKSTTLIPFFPEILLTKFNYFTSLYNNMFVGIVAIKPNFWNLRNYSIDCAVDSDLRFWSNALLALVTLAKKAISTTRKDWKTASMP